MEETVFIKVKNGEIYWAGDGDPLGDVLATNQLEIARHNSYPDVKRFIDRYNNRYLELGQDLQIINNVCLVCRRHQICCFSYDCPKNSNID